MSRIKRRAELCLIGLWILFFSTQQVWAGTASPSPALSRSAKEQDTARTGMEQAKDSVVQVVLKYTDSQGNVYLLKSGSGFLISSDVVLTSYEQLSLTQEEMTKAEQYLGEALGKPVSFQEKEGAEKITCQAGVVLYQDVIIDGEINSCSSRKLQLGILNLKEPLERERAQMKDSSTLEMDGRVSALGYKNVSVLQSSKEAKGLSQEDLKAVQGRLAGTLEQSGSVYLAHSAKVKKGAVGGPLVDEDGTVVGMNLSGRTREGEYIALSAEEICKLLDSCQIAYQAAGLRSISQEDIAGARVAREPVDTALLDEYILNYSLLERSNYTADSYQLLEAALEEARALKNDKQASQSEIDAAVERLGQAKAALVAAKGQSWLPALLTGMGVLAVFLGLILYILKLKGMTGSGIREETPLVLRQAEVPGMVEGRSLSGQRQTAGRTPEVSGTVKGRHSGAFHAEPGADLSAYPKTTVLGAEAAEEGTIVLRSSGSLPGAYLLRSSNQEKVPLGTGEFFVGKDRSQVQYCISDNPSVSRCHARIRRQQGGYYLSDMQSTNFTSLNHRVLAEGEEAELKQGDVIHFSNEEFTFYQR